MVKNEQHIIELKEVKKKMMSLDLLSTETSFEFSLTLLDMFNIIDKLETLKEKDIICTDTEAGIA